MQREEQKIQGILTKWGEKKPAILEDAGGRSQEGEGKAKGFRLKGYYGR